MDATATAATMADAPNHTATITTITTSRSPLTRLVELDIALSFRIHSACQPIIPRSLLKALEISGDGRFWFPVPIALLLSSSYNRHSLTPFLLALLAGSLLDLLLIGLVKHLVRRPRPVYNKGMYLTFAVDHWSFPSGHSSRVFFIASFLYLCSATLRDSASGIQWSVAGFHYGGGNEVIELFGRAVFLWSAATSASRILLGRHFVLDVVTGACLGVLEGLLVFHFFKSWN